MAVADHSWFDIEGEPRDRALTAVCSCGWRSTPCASARLAGTAWDVHVAVAGVASPVEPDAAPVVLAELEAALDRSEAALGLRRGP